MTYVHNMFHICPNNKLQQGLIAIIQGRDEERLRQLLGYHHQLQSIQQYSLCNLQIFLNSITIPITPMQSPQASACPLETNNNYINNNNSSSNINNMFVTPSPFLYVITNDYATQMKQQHDELKQFFQAQVFIFFFA